MTARVGPFFVPCYIDVDDAGRVVSAAPLADYYQHARVSDAGTLLTWGRAHAAAERGLAARASEPGAALT
ncbi:MAG: hypothetical protein ACYDC2_11705 [Solirubrobacteraceae bacterium]